MNSDYIIVQDELNNLSNELYDYVDRLGVAIATINASNNTEVGHEAIYEYVDYVPSNESATVDDFKNKVNDIYGYLNSIIYKKFKSFGPITNRTSEFKSSELNKLKDMIVNGKLVPVDKVDPSKALSFNNKLAAFYGTGNSLVSGPNDLISFINSLIDRTHRSSSYSKGINKVFNSINTSDAELNVPKIGGYLDIRSKLSNAKSMVSRKQTITDYRLSTIVNWFSSTVDMLSVTNTAKQGIKVHTDKYSVDTDKKIGVPSNSSTLKLIDTGLQLNSKLDSIHKSMSFTIKILTRDNTISLIKVDNNKHRFLLARFTESITRSLLTLYTNLISVDTLIISYIKLTYTSAK